MRILKALGILFLLLAAGLVAVIILGSRVPRAHIASATVVISAPQARVWQMLEDLPGQPRWRTELVAIEPAASQNGHPCWTEVQKHMRMLLCEDLTAPPSTRIVRIADPQLAFGGSWTYQVEPLDADSSRLTITENGTTGPAIWRFVGHYVYHEDTMLKQYESELQQAIARN